nr:gamma carbonic anhydrase family protein [Candidatus Njordarchaeum guaymaensis]
MLFEFDGKRPRVGSGCYIATSAEVIGDVVIGDGSYIGPGAKILGDFGKVRIGSGTAIEENVVVHARPNKECVIGNSVTVGHSSVLHDCVVKDYAVIGMGSVVSDFSTVGEWAAVGEGAIVVSGTSIPPRKVAVGIPAKPVKDISEEWKELWTLYKAGLPEIARKFSSTLKEVKPDKSRSARWRGK